MKKIKQFLKDIFAPQVHIHYHGTENLTQPEMDRMCKHADKAFDEMNKAFEEMRKVVSK